MIRLSFKVFPGTNALAYFVPTLVAKNKIEKIVPLNFWTNSEMFFINIFVELNTF